MKNLVLRWRDLALLMAALLLSACAGSHSAGQVGGDAAAQLDEQLAAEIEQLAKPEGVSAQLWEKLTAELARVLAERGARRGVASAAIGKGSAVGDFWLKESGAVVTAYWGYRNQGDYDLNGEVNISDLTQIGLHFGRKSSEANWQDVQVVDGDGNGEINIGDITPMGQNFGGQVVGYALQKGPAQEGPWTVETWLPFVAPAPGSNEYPQYSWDLAAADPASYYRVCSTGNNADPYEFGAASNAVLWGDADYPGWNMFGGDAAHTSRSSLLGPSTNQVAWEFPFAGFSVIFAFYNVAPVSDHFGTTYFTSLEMPEGSASTPDFSASVGHLYAVDKQGQLVFHHIFSIATFLPPVVLPNQTVLVMDILGKIYCFSRDGKIIWTQQVAGIAGDSITLTPLTVTPTGNFYVCDQSPSIYKMDSNGNIIWDTPLPAAATNAVTLLGSAVCVAVEAETVNPPRLLFFTTIDGAPSGITDLPDEVKHSVVLETGNFLYFLDDSTSLNTISLGINPPWIFMDPNIRTSASLTWGGERVVGTGEGSQIAFFTGILYGLNTAGGISWTRPLGAGVLSEPLVDGADSIYVSTLGSVDASGIYCINTAHNIEWYHPEPGYTSGICLAKEGLITYMTTEGDISSEIGAMKLVAIGTP